MLFASSCFCKAYFLSVKRVTVPQLVGTLYLYHDLLQNGVCKVMSRGRGMLDIGYTKINLDPPSHFQFRMDSCISVLLLLFEWIIFICDTILSKIIHKILNINDFI